ncbi:hypothetical protein [Angelakisella massiliensis]|uniref:hypothetical protein n=1 Tax=Angelakisella massiliensis TaxID=1871018 RepID=UPI0024B1AB69|nr:hypothetical protein [Angelakisella massiliensis]
MEMFLLYGAAAALAAFGLTQLLLIFWRWLTHGAEAERAFLVVEIRPDDPAAESRLSGVLEALRGQPGLERVSLAVLCPEGGCSREVCLRFCQDHGLSLAQNWHCLAEGFEKEGEMDYNESC